MNKASRNAIRKYIAIYPRDSAMHGAVQVHVPHFGYVTFTPNHWGRRNWSIVVSHNATPWAATFVMGPGQSDADKAAARVRRALFGFGRRSLAWCQEIGATVEMAEHIANLYPDDPPVSTGDLERRMETDR